MHCGAIGFHPCSFATVRTTGGSSWADAFGFQVPEEEARTLLLSDDDRPDSAADVGIESPQSLDRFRRAEPEMRYPSRQESTDAFHPGCDGSSPPPSPHPPHFLHHPFHSLTGT